MAGRWVRKLSLTGFALAGALGCNRSAVQSTDAQPLTGVPMQVNNNKSLWNPPAPQPAAEVVAEAPKKGPVKPETDVALADVHLAVALDEKTPEANRAAALDTARLLYQKALQIDPKNKTALLGLARFYSRIGERDKAVETFQKCLAVFPGDREITAEVARVHAKWQDWNGAIAWYERALKIDPENISYRKEMAFCLAISGQLQRAYEVFLTIMPEPQARYCVARVLEGQNHVDASRQQLLFALQADPSFADARDRLADLDRNSQPAAAPTDPNAIQRASYVPEQ